jgi:hypothetical protein
MDILLPATNDNSPLITGITDSGFKEMTGKLASKKINLYLPLFKHSFKNL